MENELKHIIITSEVLERHQLDSQKRWVRNKVEYMTTQQIADRLNSTYFPRHSSLDPSIVNNRHIFGTLGNPYSELDFIYAHAIDENTLSIKSDYKEHVINVADYVIGIRRGPDIDRNYVDFLYITEAVNNIELEQLRRQDKSLISHFIAPAYSCNDEARHYAYHYFIEYEPALREQLRVLESADEMKSRRK